MIAVATQDRVATDWCYSQRSVNTMEGEPPGEPKGPKEAKPLPRGEGPASRRVQLGRSLALQIKE